MNVLKIEFSDCNILMILIGFTDCFIKIMHDYFKEML